MSIRWLCAIVVSVVAAACGSSGGAGSSVSPTATAASLAGSWVGTFSRPSGLSPIQVTWTATQSDFNLSGPLKMTNNGTYGDGHA